MGSNHIHIFIEKILATATCPRCGQGVLLKDISFESATERTCTFRISCQHCRNEAIAQASLQVDQEQEYLKKISPPRISEIEILKVQGFFKANSQIPAANLFA